MNKFKNLMVALFIIGIVVYGASAFTNFILPDDPIAKIPVPEYSIGSTQEYVQEGSSGIAYRVATTDDLDTLSDDQLHAIYRDVTKDDDYTLHTVWFYKDWVYSVTGGGYDAMIEEVSYRETELTRR